MVRSTRKEADPAEELQRLAGLAGSEGGSAEAEEDLLRELVHQGASGLNDDPGFTTRVKPPKSTPKEEKKPEAKSEPRQRKTTPRATASERQLADVGENLEEKIGVIFGLASGVAPVTSTYAIENSDKAIRALLDIAKRRPAVLRALTKLADGADAMEIGKFVLGLLVAIQVDTGRLNGDELPARAFGVTEVMVRHDFMSASPHAPAAPNEQVMEQVVNPGAFTYQPV